MVSRERPVERALLERMQAPLRHRGPDGEGIFISPDQKTGLVHRRLSIIDLAGGSQPMTSASGESTVVFNGEIYNFAALRAQLAEAGRPCRTRCDTEVIVEGYELWGDAVVNKLHGMFAFALWDEKKKRLLAARDRLGIKPFYYADRPQGVYFASELKSILADPSLERSIDPAAMDAYFHLLYIPAPLTIYQGIRKLMPGHYLTLEEGRITEHRYWDLDGIEERPQSMEAIGESIRALLKQSVRDRLISDVPLGAFLSGGIDSSAIAACMAESSSRRVKTFSIGFEEGGEYDERRHARRIAELFGTDHTEFVVKMEALSVLPMLTEMFDEPFADSSAIPTYYVSKLAREHVTVVLSGTGGDEFFAGYRRHLVQGLADKWRRVPGLFRSLVRLGLAPLPVSRRNKLGETILYAKRFMELTSGDFRRNNYATANFLSADLAERIYRPEIRESLNSDEAYRILLGHYERVKNKAPLRQILYGDAKVYLPDDLLVKEDRMTMAVSLEGRVPFCDHRLAEYAHTIPSALLTKNGELKRVLKRALEPLIPRENIYRRKHGFAVPIGEWFKTDLGDHLLAVLEEGSGKGSPLLDGEGVRSVLAAHRKGTFDYSNLLWAVLMFERWRLRWIEGESL